MADFPDFDEGKRRRIRRRNYTDDAWGMADDADHYDGPSGDIEDWASGLVDEEGQSGQGSRKYGQTDSAIDPSAIPARSRRTIEEFHARQQAQGKDISAGTDRSERFRQRLGRDAIPSYESSSGSRQKNKRSTASYPPEIVMKSKPTPSIMGFPLDFNNLSPIWLAVLVLTALATCSCMGLALYWLLG